MSRVTIAVPVFNGARFLGETIDSLLGQTMSDSRILCIDDASTDDSAAIIRAAGPRVEHHQNARRLGLAANWNRALELCHTPYLVIAHQDDVYHPEFSESLERTLDRMPRAFAVHSKAISVDANGHVVRDPASEYKDRFWTSANPQERPAADELRALRKGNFIIAPGVMLRMEAVRQIGAFDTSFEFVTDWDYWIRGVVAGFTIGGIHERLVSFRRHPDTATRQSEISLRRYEEERALLERIRAIAPSRRPFLALENTIIADFARRLATDDAVGAARLLSWADRNILRFSGSLRALLMNACLAGGSRAGVALQLLVAERVRAESLAHRTIAGAARLGKNALRRLIP